MNLEAIFIDFFSTEIKNNICLEVISSVIKKVLKISQMIYRIDHEIKSTSHLGNYHWYNNMDNFSNLYCCVYP